MIDLPSIFMRSAPLGLVYFLRIINFSLKSRKQIEFRDNSLAGQGNALGDPMSNYMEVRFY